MSLPAMEDFYRHSVMDDFFSYSSSFVAEPREHSPHGNYVVTLRKPTAVTHSCCGHFTSPKELNLVICKVSLVSIYLMTENVLEHLREFPMYGRVVFMELSHVDCLNKDILFIATEFEKFCMFEWNVEASNVVSLETVEFYPSLTSHVIGDQSYEHYDFCQGGTVHCGEATVVVLYSRKNRLRTIDINNMGLSAVRFTENLPTAILDVKFLKTRTIPRLAFLCRGTHNNFYSGILGITADGFTAEKIFHIDQTMLPTFLIPSLNTFLVIGEKGVIFCSLKDTSTKLMENLNIQHTFGRLEDTDQICRYLIAGNGHLSLIEVKIDEGLSTLTFTPICKHSEASCLTCLGDDFVFIGSRNTDSQLVKILNMNLATLQVLQTFTNTGPIKDFSVQNKHIGFKKLVMCCGVPESSYLEGLITAVGISPKMMVKIPNMQRIWSLKSSRSDDNGIILVLQPHPTTDGQALLISTNDSDELMEYPMEDFNYNSATICCHDVADRKFIQVTEEFVQLIDSETGVRKNSLFLGSKIMFASATMKQVLLSTSDKRLHYLEIRNGSFVKMKYLEGLDISCLDISPVGVDSTYSKMAVVGLWGKAVGVLKLPGLEMVTIEQIKPLNPRCVLLCPFEQVPYLLCASDDGTLLTYKVNEDNGQLREKNTKKLEGFPKALRSFVSNGVVHVLLSTTKTPMLIFTEKQKLQYNRLNLKEIEDMCPIQLAQIPEGLAIVTQDEVILCTIGDTEKKSKVPMCSYGRRLCYQEESQSYAILVEEKNGKHSVQLIDEQLKTHCLFGLKEHERGLSIISCSFAGDERAYYCVGTSVNAPGVEATLGRILVFEVRDGELDMVSQYQTFGPVYYIKPLHGGILVTVSLFTVLYFEWQLQGDDHALFLNPNLAGNETDECEEIFAVLSSMYQNTEWHYLTINPDPRYMVNPTALLMLGKNCYFSGDGLYNINSADKWNSEFCHIVGKWYFGQAITHIKAGNSSRLSDEDMSKTPSVMFSTESGAVGMIITLPRAIYNYLSKLEEIMRKTVSGKGCPNELHPRKCVKPTRFSASTEIIDGDFVESFQILNLADQLSIARELGFNVNDIISNIAYLELFH